MFISIKKPLLIILATFSILSCNKKEAEYETNTFIKNWLILGPFPNCEDCGTENYKHGENCAGFYTDYLKSAGGEKNLIPTPGMKIEFAEPGLNMEWFSYKSETDKIPVNISFSDNVKKESVQIFKDFLSLYPPFPSI